MTVIKRREGWPTPCASGDLHYRLGGKSQASKCLAVAVYPTPNSRYSKPGTARPHGGGSRGQAPQRNLNDIVIKYPTPTAHDRYGHCPSELRRVSPNLSAVAARYDTPTVHGDGGSGRKGTMPKYGQLNPDWEEWLMAWPVGWTDIETPNIRLVWLDPSIDPADYGEIPRVTNRRDNRPARVKEIGNGQFPLTAAAAFHWGLCVLQLVNKEKNENR